jgi:hypothetical protein
VIKVLRACTQPQKSAEIQGTTEIKHRVTFQRNHLDRLLFPPRPPGYQNPYQLTDALDGSAVCTGAQESGLDLPVCTTRVFRLSR